MFYFISVFNKDYSDTEREKSTTIWPIKYLNMFDYNLEINKLRFKLHRFNLGLQEKYILLNVLILMAITGT